MGLAQLQWNKTSVHEIVAEYLRAEKDRLACSLSPENVRHLAPLIEQPDLANPSQNHARLRCLWMIRGRLFAEIPPDTEWFEVRSLSRNHLCNLHVIARCGWDDPDDQNELYRVAARKPEVLRTAPSQWLRPILWGHARSGPFTIIEGNHRLIGYASSKEQAELSIPVLVGLSPSLCFWHHFDPCGFIANDLLK
jgi:hypothetical protein